jgi:RNA polymerase sigma-70 factor (ECF subfamily)
MAEPNAGFVERLFAEHGRALHAYFLRRLRVKTDAPDLAQEVYLRLLRVGDVDAIRNPQHYLFTVASNLLKEHGVAQQHRRTTTVGVAAPMLDDLPSESPAVEGEVDADRRLARLREVLEELPPRWRNAVILQYRYGLTYAQIGEHLGVSPNMVKKYLAQALARCRRRMARWE